MSAEPHSQPLLRALHALDRVLDAALAQMAAPRADADQNLSMPLDAAQRLLAEMDDNPAHIADQGPIIPAMEGRLAELAGSFGLSPWEATIMLIALAPALDRRYERLYAFIQDDMTRRRPTVDFVLRLLHPSPTARMEALAYFVPQAPLLRQELVQLVADPGDHRPSLLLRELHVDDRIVQYVLGSDTPDARLDGYIERTNPAQPSEHLLLPTGWPQRLTAMARTGEPTICYVQGGAGAGKQTLAEAMVALAGKRVLVAVDLASLVERDEATFGTMLRLIRREALLQDALLYFHGCDILFSDERRGARLRWLQEIGEERLVVAGGTAPWPPDALPLQTHCVQLQLPPPTPGERLALWLDALPAATAAAIGDQALSELASRFRLHARQIQAAAALAGSSARWRDEWQPQITVDELYAACRAQSSPRLETLARSIVPRRGWDDLVLPPDRLRQLQELCAQVRWRERVLDDWGFGRKLASSVGVSALFAGPSGTGKTMAAEIIAGELGLQLYAIDLATVVSKYIGETEKNLARIFAEAEASNVILFFDEADALFGKRSDVKDAHDRYANLEVAYLLQRIEAYDGITILATNLRKNMDDAFVRRMQFIVEFPFPDEHERRRIWQQVWPAEAPRDRALDLEWLARHCEIAGGTIRNVALQAAFLAAANGGVVTMEHLIHATRREYGKLGKVIGAGEFGPFDAGTRK